jgi:gliding motility-associated-like protein
MKLLKPLILLLFCVPGILWAQNPNWSINASSFQYSMTMVSVSLTNCEIDNDPNNQIAAFINGTLAGFTNTNTTVNGDNYAYLVIYSNSPGGESINFKIYDADNDVVIDAKQTQFFQENASLGNVSNPIEIASEYKLTSLDLNNITLYDYSGIDNEIGHFLLINEMGDSTAASYSFIYDSLGTENTSFDFMNNLLILNEEVDYPTQDTFNIHVTATTSYGCEISNHFVLDVFNTNVAPTDIIQYTGCLDENSEEGSYITLLIAIDTTPNDIHTFEFVEDRNFPDNQFFEINYDELLSSQVFDYETKNFYSLQIKVTDEIGNFYVDTFYVNICDVIEYENALGNNFISPDGDGINDVFKIPNVELYNNFALHIYNDNGNEIYYTDGNYNNTWNGVNNDDKGLPSGTYLFHFVDQDDASLEFNGRIIIQRDNKY